MKKTPLDKLQLGGLISQLHRGLVAQLNRRFAEHGHDISVEQFVLLIKLSMEDGQSQQGLAEKTATSRANITFLVRKLAQKGLIVQIPDQKDLRSNRICLTPAGKNTAKTLLTVAEKELHQLTQACLPEEMEMFMAVVQKLITQLQIDCQKGNQVSDEPI